MNVMVRPGVALAEFLEWEREQEERYEFDGVQPILMNGVTVGHARLVRRIMIAPGLRLPRGYEAFGGDLKVCTSPNRMRYPDVTVVHGKPRADADSVVPVVVFEVLSASTALTDLRVKPAEYGATASMEAYVILAPDDVASVTVLHRANGWTPEPVVGTLHLPEIGVAIPLDELYAA